MNFLHYALDSDLGRFKPFVIIETLAGLRGAMANDHLARTMTYEVSGMQVGAAVHSVGDAGINRATGEIAQDVRERIEKSMNALSHFAQARVAM